jgi:hypothetical protein
MQNGERAKMLTAVELNAIRMNPSNLLRRLLEMVLIPFAIAFGVSVAIDNFLLKFSVITGNCIF